MRRERDPFVFVLRPYCARWRTERGIRKMADSNSDVLRPQIECPVHGASAIRTEMIGDYAVRIIDPAHKRFRYAR